LGYIIGLVTVGEFTHTLKFTEERGGERQVPGGVLKMAVGKIGGKKGFFDQKRKEEKKGQF